MSRLDDSRGGAPTAREGLPTLLASAGAPRESRYPRTAASLSAFQGTRPTLCGGRDASTPRARAGAPCLRWIISDTQTDMLLGEPKSAICVQRFDDSLNSAIHTTYRSWLRSSSMREPRDPPSKVVSRISNSRPSSGRNIRP